MKIGRIAWWLLPGMFGWGAGVGFLISLLVGRKLVQSMSDGLWGDLYGPFFAIAGMVVITPMAGLVSVALTFVAHRAGWDKPLPYLAAIGFVFLLLLAGWVLWTLCKPRST